MGNDNKIEKFLEPRTNLFLKDDVQVDQSLGKVYNLQEEFQKTKKNKNYFAYIVVILFVIISLGTAFIVSKYIENKSRNVNIEITDFEDINLRDLLSTVKRNEAKLNQLNIELESLKTESQNEQIKIRDTISADREIIANKNISQEDRKLQIDALKAKERKLLAQSKQKFATRISEKEKEITEIKKILENYDKELSESAKKTEDMLNNYQKLHELKMKKQQSDYEKKIKELKREHYNEKVSLRKYYKNLIEVLIVKFNPVLDQEPMNKILNDADSLSNIGMYKPSRSWVRNGIVKEDYYYTYLNNLQDLDSIFKTWNRIEYTNSVPALIKKNQYLTTHLLNQFAFIVESKVLLLQEYETGLKEWVKMSKENGYIINTRDENRLLVFLDEHYKLQSGDKGLIFRDDDELIASVEFYPEIDSMRAKILQYHSTNRVKPFDKVLIQLKSGE